MSFAPRGPDNITPLVSPLDFDWNLEFQHDATVLGLEYWESRCQGRLMPRREDLDPVAMRKFTGHVGLVEIRPGIGEDVEYFIRRAGTKWEDVYGPITGRYLHEFLPPKLETCWRTAFDAVRKAKAPVRITTKIDFRGRNWLSSECLVAPLGISSEPSMLFVTFVAWGEQIFQSPPNADLLHGA